MQFYGREKEAGNAYDILIAKLSNFKTKRKIQEEFCSCICGLFNNAASNANY